MRVHHLSALVALALSAALLTSACLQSPTTTLEADEPASPSVEQASEQAGDTEPIGEAQEEQAWLPAPSYGSGVFPFVVAVKDDGEGTAAGWQKANVVLRFSIVQGIHVTYRWTCPIEIGMPLRSQAEGRISKSRAALITAEIATAVVGPLGDSRPDWEGQGTAFCTELYARMQTTFSERYPGYGARVKRWQ
jgi:hypothetical protein